MRRWPDGNREVLLALWHKVSLGAGFLGRHWKMVPPVVSVVLSVIIVFGFSAVAERQNTSNLEKCDRDNVSRVASIEDKRIEVRAILKEAGAWELVLALTPRKPDPNPKEVKVLKGFKGYIHGLNEEARDKQRAIRKTIAAQVEVAVRPGSPVVDCNKAFP